MAKAYLLWQVMLCLATPLVRGAMQFCHDDSNVPIKFCMALETRDNQTTSHKDLSVTVGFQRLFENGWMALGLGESMFGALMFVQYLTNDHGPVLSVRHGRGHVEPRPIEDLSGLDLVAHSQNHSHWMEASFTIYSFDELAPVSRNGKLPLMWSINNAMNTKSATADSHLEMHEYYGHFTFNQAEAHTSSASPQFPLIEHGKPNDNLENGDNQDQGRLWAWAPALHGYFMALATMVLFPTGIIGMRGGFKNGFRLHATIQISGIILIVVGLGLVIAMVVGGGWAYLTEPHVLLGLSLIALISFQAYIGWKKHKHFVAGEPAAKLARTHIFLGRSIPLASCVNGLLGLKLAGSAPINYTLLAIVGVFQLGLFAVHWWTPKQKAVNYEHIKEGDFDSSKEDVSLPFLEDDHE